MWGVWSDVHDSWLGAGLGVFVTELQSVAEAQVYFMNRQREVKIQQLEAKAAEMRRQQSGIVTPSAIQVPGMGTVPIRGNGQPANPGVPQGNIEVQIGPDAEWRARRYDEWWKQSRQKLKKAASGETVDLTG